MMRLCNAEMVIWHLLRRHVEGDGAEVHLLVGLDTRQDEEYSWVGHLAADQDIADFLG